MNHNYLFIHIPKNAGTSISQTLAGVRNFKFKMKEWGLGGHRHPFFNKEISPHWPISKYNVESLFKFCFVRNPVDRFVSAFYYLRDCEYKKPGANENTHKYLSEYDGDINTFIEEWHSHPANPIRRPHFLKQTFFIKIDNQIKVDFIGLFDNLEKDFNFILDKIGYPKVELKKTNRTPKINRTKLTSKSIRKIEELYAEDVELYHELLKR